MLIILFICDVYQLPSPALYLLHTHPGVFLKTHYQVRGEQGRGQGCNMVRGRWGIFRQIDFLSSKGGINEKKCSQMPFESLPPKDVTIKS